MYITYKIALRYLWSQYRNSTVSFVSIITILGLAFGIATLIVVLSLMNGFHKEIRSQIFAAIPHASVGHYSGEIKEWESAEQQIISHPDVLAISPFIQSFVLLNHLQNATGAILLGVDLEKEQQVIESMQKMGVKKDDLSGFKLVIGYRLAQRLNVRKGDRINVISTQLNYSLLGVTPQFRSFEVAEVFRLDNAQLDDGVAYTNLEALAKLERQLDNVSGFRIKVRDLFDMDPVILSLLDKLAAGFYVVDWRDQNRAFFNALQLEKRMTVIILILIIAIASFNMISTMIITVNSKRRDIMILRIQGLTPTHIALIFFYQSILIGIIGVGLGVALGVLLGSNIDILLIAIERFGIEVFPRNIYNIDNFPVQLLLSDIILITTVTMILVFLSAMYPAWRSGRFSIVSTLRND